ncbi:MAG: cytochrome c biogenesis heme-transporting ATPase CcmA [Burkholderiaceae bacterium]|nr:cytochrome c biogenesis heme-transporting ATPase CcmA [Burkholderiaceae bacterium]
MLVARGLSCIRGERRLFSGVDFAVNPGEWVYVRGQNGVGKTSLLRILVGLAHAETGQVFWDNEPIGACRSLYHKHLLYQGHHACIKDELTALENLRLSAGLDGVELDEDRAMRTLRRFGLRGREELPVRSLSAGQKRRVGMARLLSRSATLWVLDEPFTALDTAAVDMLAGVLSEHVAEGGMVVLTSHQPVPMDHGKVLEL